MRHQAVFAKLRENTVYAGVDDDVVADNVVVTRLAQILQALYMDNPEGIAAYAKSPVKKRDDYPEMPPQGHLDDETLLEAAKFMLKIKK